jgi:hypothetical protein
MLEHRINDFKECSSFNANDCCTNSFSINLRSRSTHEIADQVHQAVIMTVVRVIHASSPSARSCCYI